MRSLTAALLLTIALGATACSPEYAAEERRVQEGIHNRLVEAVPAPEVNGAAAREAIVRHLQRWQSGDVVSYVTLFSDVGTPIGYYTASGKIASTCQMLTAPDRLSSGVLRKAPALDGTYYTASDCGIFFFTAESDAYVEWNGVYLVTDQPLAIDVQPLEVAPFTDEGSP